MFLPYGAEDEVGILLGHIFQFRLCTIEESFPNDPSGAYGNLRLSHMITGTAQILFHPQRHFYTHLLMWLQHFIKDILHRLEKSKGADQKQEDIDIALSAVPEKEVKQIECHHRQRNESDHSPVNHYRGE